MYKLCIACTGKQTTVSCVMIFFTHRCVVQCGHTPSWSNTVKNKRQIGRRLEAVLPIHLYPDRACWSALHFSMTNVPWLQMFPQLLPKTTCLIRQYKRNELQSAPNGQEPFKALRGRNKNCLIIFTSFKVWVELLRVNVSHGISCVQNIVQNLLWTSGKL